MTCNNDVKVMGISLLMTPVISLLFKMLLDIIIWVVNIWEKASHPYRGFNVEPCSQMYWDVLSLKAPTVRFRDKEPIQPILGVVTWLRNGRLPGLPAQLEGL